MSGRQAVSRIASTRTWIQWARVANFVGYDARERYAAEIGADVRISPTVSFRNGRHISIGDATHVGQGSLLWGGDDHGRISIGDHALLAPRVFITASNYDFDSDLGPVMDLPHREADVHIGANTWIGANVVVVAGVRIGDGAIVAAGSVVARDVPPNSVVAGVPARHVRFRGESRKH